MQTRPHRLRSTLKAARGPLCRRRLPAPLLLLLLLGLTTASTGLGQPAARPSQRSPQRAAATATKGAARSRGPARKGSKPKLTLTHVRHLVLDPGHGGRNLGAVGFHASREKVLTLEISRAIQAYVEARSNVRVTLTRTKDVDLALRERPRLANKLKADALISVHCNANPKPSVHGIEVWFLTADTSMKVVHDIVRREEGVPDAGPAIAKQWSARGVVEKLRHAEAHRRSQALAIALRQGMRVAMPGIRFRGIRQDAFGVLKEARMPAVVLEVGYITHPEEGLRLAQGKTHKAIARAVMVALVRLDAHLAQLKRRPTKAP